MYRESAGVAEEERGQQDGHDDDGLEASLVAEVSQCMPPPAAFADLHARWVRRRYGVLQTMPLATRGFMRLGRWREAEETARLGGLPLAEQVQTGGSARQGGGAGSSRGKDDGSRVSGGLGEKRARAEGLENDPIDLSSRCQCRCLLGRIAIEVRSDRACAEEHFLSGLRDALVASTEAAEPESYEMLTIVIETARQLKIYLPDATSAVAEAEAAIDKARTKMKLIPKQLHKPRDRAGDRQTRQSIL